MSTKQETVGAEKSVGEIKTTEKKTKSRRKKAAARSVPIGRAYIHATFNNTILAFADLNGNIIGWSSAGKVGFRGPKKATPYAATMVVKDLIEKTSAAGIKDVHVLTKGIGAGRDSAIRSLNAGGINILSVKDVTPIPHNGCRPPKPRRI